MRVFVYEFHGLAENVLDSDCMWIYSLIPIVHVEGLLLYVLKFNKIRNSYRFGTINAIVETK